MRIEYIINIPKNAVCEARNKFCSVHIDPKNGNEIHSSYDDKGNLAGREIVDKCGNGFGIYFGANGILWLCPFKEGFSILESRIPIGRSKSDK